MDLLENEVRAKSYGTWVCELYSENKRLKNCKQENGMIWIYVLEK